MNDHSAPMRPDKTILVCKHNGREVGRIPATARTAEIYLEEMALHYKDLVVEYIHDENADLIALFKGPCPEFDW